MTKISGYQHSTGSTISDVNPNNENKENPHLEKPRIINFPVTTTVSNNGVISIPIGKVFYGNVIMMPVAKASGYYESKIISVSTDNHSPKKSLTIDDLGWTKEQAIAVRGLFGSFAEDWDDPAMDVYNDL